MINMFPKFVVSDSFLGVVNLSIFIFFLSLQYGS